MPTYDNYLNVARIDNPTKIQDNIGEIRYTKNLYGNMSIPK